MEPVIALRGVVSVLGRFPVLAGVDLDVGRSEIVLLSGPNGAGKTSLLRLCSGLLAPVSGTASVLGHALPRSRRRLRRRVGYLGHANALYDDLTVAENARFWARAAGATPEDAEAALDRLAVPGRLRDVEALHLSAGQRRRVALAVLVARRPELWLLDEPHAGLDAAARDELDALVLEAAAAGATVLVASHELERSGALARRVVCLAGGVVVADDAVAAPAPSPSEAAAPLRRTASDVA
ncbi:MAG: heme ABC exporter ATP-binding protein CcmA [Acidimicrobiia bacterium]|nr:heme ABC exporter ATP-binding protein CcmA [Acidimicrobiia bacterium]